MWMGVTHTTPQPHNTHDDARPLLLFRRRVVGRCGAEKTVDGVCFHGCMAACRQTGKLQKFSTFIPEL
jgi:hypothetical protein